MNIIDSVKQPTNYRGTEFHRRFWGRYYLLLLASSTTLLFYSDDDSASDIRCNKLTREIPEKKLKYIVRKLYISNQHEETNAGNEINGTRRVMPISHVHCTMDLSWKKYVYLRQTKGRLDITRSSRFILEQ